ERAVADGRREHRGGRAPVARQQRPRPRGARVSRHGSAIRRRRRPAAHGHLKETLMRSTREALKFALCAAALAAAAGAARDEVTDTRMLKDSVRVLGLGPPTVIVRNVFGSVHVVAHDGATVDMTATETVSGDLRADIDRARKEVELRTESEE